jgi:hypothetical protein
MRPNRIGWIAAVYLLLGGGRLQAAPLVITDFTSLGAFPTTPGSYMLDTSGTPTLTGPGGLSIAGVIGPDSIAVFTFDSILIGAGFTVRGMGDRPWLCCRTET